MVLKKLKNCVNLIKDITIQLLQSQWCSQGGVLGVKTPTLVRIYIKNIIFII